MTVLWHKPLCWPSPVSTPPTLSPRYYIDLDSFWNAGFSGTRNESAPAWIMASHFRNNSSVLIIFVSLHHMPSCLTFNMWFWLIHRAIALISESVLVCTIWFSWLRGCPWLMPKLIPAKSVDSLFDLFPFQAFWHLFMPHHMLFVFHLSWFHVFSCSSYPSRSGQDSSVSTGTEAPWSRWVQTHHTLYGICCPFLPFLHAHLDITALLSLV